METMKLLHQGLSLMLSVHDLLQYRFDEIPLRQGVNEMEGFSFLLHL